MRAVPLIVLILFSLVSAFAGRDSRTDEARQDHWTQSRRERLGRWHSRSPARASWPVVANSSRCSSLRRRKGFERWGGNRGRFGRESRRVREGRRSLSKGV